MNAPLVSISCITYNHDPYIRQCLEGILMQECDFEYEILIHDDASTDGTSDIIREYQGKYPEIIKPIIQTQNQWSQGIRGMMPRFNFPRAKGKYIALCEGDDYWTDPFKLQKQVDFLEANPEFSFCFHDTYQLNQKTGEKYLRIGNRSIDEIVDLKSVIIQNNFPTASLLFKTSSYKPQLNILSKSSKGDYVLVVRLAEKGLGKYLPRVMSVYRLHGGGVWSMKDTSYKLHEDLKFYNYLYEYFNDKSIRKIIIQKRNKTYESLAFHDLRNQKFIKGLKCWFLHLNFTTDKRLKPSPKKVLSAIKEGINKINNNINCKS